MDTDTTTEDLLGSARELAIRLRHELARSQLLLSAMSAAVSRGATDELDVLAEMAESFAHPSRAVPDSRDDIVAWASEQLAALQRREQSRMSAPLDP